jgi:hypothetical protein
MSCLGFFCSLDEPDVALLAELILTSRDALNRLKLKTIINLN